LSAQLNEARFRFKSSAMLGRTATAIIESPIGPLKLTADDAHLLGVRIGRFGARATENAQVPTGHPVLGPALEQFRSWFAGERTTFDLPLLPLDSKEGDNLRKGIASIPYGETLTYGALASQVGSVARAVGQVCKTNAYPILIPCHRVVSSAGPEYYSAGDGARTKSWLLDFEYANLPPEKRNRLL
jgi:methylated-DNA-[protein]-cysteine S-methyltransferase